MEKLPPDLPEKVSSLEPAAPTEQPRPVKPGSTSLVLLAIIFLTPLLIMVIFAIFLITLGLSAS